jgi:hypothetical protein
VTTTNYEAISQLPTYHEWVDSTIDRTGWATGDWDDEPDKMVWVDPATDLDCMIHRVETTGALCGYVGVPTGNPAFGEEPFESGYNVHGGVTYGSPCQPGEDPSQGICHVPEPGRPEEVYWLGFDCSHAWDVMPAMMAREAALGMPPMPDFGDRFPRTTYKDVNYVIAEIRKLAEQVAAKR